MIPGNSIQHRRIVAVVLFAVITVSVWLGLDRLGNEVAWLTLEGPPQVRAGTTVRLQVQTTRLLTNGFLCVDWHWASDRNSPQGFLASGSTQVRHPLIMEFSLPVPTREQLRFVNAIVYFTPDGSWSNHTFAATTALIPVATTGERPAAELVRLPLYQLEAGGPAASPPKFSPLRWLTGATWLCGTALLARRIRHNHTQPARSNGSKRGWMALAIGLMLAGVWELAGLENTLGNWARSFAQAEDVYYPRAGFQKVVISVVIALVPALFWVGWRRQGGRLLPLGFGLYLTLAVVNLLSLHAIDRIATVAWGGLVLVDGLKLLCAAVALYGLCAENGRLPPPTPD